MLDYWAKVTVTALSRLLEQKKRRTIIDPRGSWAYGVRSRLWGRSPSRSLETRKPAPSRRTNAPRGGCGQETDSAACYLRKWRPGHLPWAAVTPTVRHRFPRDRCEALVSPLPHQSYRLEQPWTGFQRTAILPLTTLVPHLLVCGDETLCAPLHLIQPKLHMMSRTLTLVSLHSSPVVLGPGRLKVRQGPYSGAAQLALGAELGMAALRWAVTGWPHSDGKASSLRTHWAVRSTIARPVSNQRCPPSARERIQWTALCGMALLLLRPKVELGLGHSPQLSLYPYRMTSEAHHYSRRSSSKHWDLLLRQIPIRWISSALNPRHPKTRSIPPEPDW